MVYVVSVLATSAVPTKLESVSGRQRTRYPDTARSVSGAVQLMVTSLVAWLPQGNNRWRGRLGVSAGGPGGSRSAAAGYHQASRRHERKKCKKCKK